MPDKASKLLEKMRNSRAQWKRQDIVSLYRGFGFVVSPGGKHDKVFHPEFPQLVTFLPQHRKIAAAYVTVAVEIVDQLIKLRQEKESASHDGP